MRWADIVCEAVRAYHGSNSPDVAFVMGHTGENSHTFGHYQNQRFGAFFTDNPDFAGLYGRPAAYDLNIQHTLDFAADRGDVIHEFAESLDAFDPDERPVWMGAKNVLQGHWHHWHRFEGELGRRFSAFLLERGYDSATLMEHNEDDGGQEHGSCTIVVLKPELISKAN